MDNNLELMAGSTEGAISIHTGFPNPAIDRLERKRGSTLDLNQLLIKHPTSTYLFRIAGHQWHREGVFDGDLALIDRALQPKASDLVIIWQDSGFMVCRYHQVTAEDTFWGAIRSIIHQYK
jgi:DNA polymerase V